MASYYVNPSAGSDTNPSTEVGPFQTITKALSEASPIDTIFLVKGKRSLPLPALPILH